MAWILPLIWGCDQRRRLRQIGTTGKSAGCGWSTNDCGVKWDGVAQVPSVIASAAKQSISLSKERMDCFVASLLAMTTDTVSRSRGAFRPSFALLVPPSQQRAQGMPGAWCARRRACEGRKQKAHALVRSHRNTRHSPRNGLRLISRSPRGPGSFAPVVRRANPANLAPASGRQDHTILPSASGSPVKRAARVHRIPLPASVTLRNAPLWDGTKSL